MIEIIIIGIATILASVGVSFYKELIIFKDIADAGYLIDLEMMRELDTKINEKIKSNSLHLLLFPFMGLLFSLSNLISYYQYREQLINQLGFFDILRKMSDSQYRDYIKNPTILNAFLTVLKAEANIQYMSIPDKKSGLSSKFRYQFNEDISDIEVIEVEGPAADLTYREQQDMIKRAWLEIGKEVSYEYGTLDNFEKHYRKKKNIELDDHPVDEILALEAQVSSIKLRKIDKDNLYFEVELVDEDGKKMGVFGNPYITDLVNFRKEVFGILMACGINDFLKLGGRDKVAIPITFKCNSSNVVSDICNANNEVFHLNSEGKYVVEPKVQDEQEIFDGHILSLESSSDTLGMLIENEHFHTTYLTGNLYYGFGYPLITSSNNPKLLELACRHYREYIENILIFLGTDDLLKMAGEPVKLPKVLFERDSTGNIIAIGQNGLDSHLRVVDNNYKIEKGKLIVDKNKSKKLI